ESSRECANTRLSRTNVSVLHTPGTSAAPTSSSPKIRSFPRSPIEKRSGKSIALSLPLQRRRVDAQNTRGRLECRGPCDDSRDMFAFELFERHVGTKLDRDALDSR